MLHIIDYRYLPDPLEVTPGQLVVIMSFPDTGKTEDETEPHTVTDVAEPPRFDIRNIPPDASPHPFNAPLEPGEHPYFCRYHGDRQGSGMVGTLVVREGSPAPTPSPTPTASAAPAPSAEAGGQETPWPAWMLILGGAAGAALRRRR